MFGLAARALVLSVGDLVQASRCEYALLCEVDRHFGRTGRSTGAHRDSAWSKALLQGQLHERNVLAEYRRRFGAAAVVQIPRPRECTESALEASALRTFGAMRSGAKVIYQATIFDGRLLGYADFLVRESDDRWRVEDAKLTAAAEDEARWQVAAYSAVLSAAGVPLASSATIRLGDGGDLDVPLDDVVPAFMVARERLESLTDAHVRGGRQTLWGSGEVNACGHCGDCREAMEAERDILLVDGVNMEERAALHHAGIRTMHELAAAEAVFVDLPQVTLERLRRQAALQLQPGESPNVPSFEVLHPELLGRLPKPDPADLFLSFAAQGRPKNEEKERDHLFTAVALSGPAQTYWGDDRQAEAGEFVRFLAEAGERRRRFPGMRIYHYSPIDRPHLIDLAERSGAGREQVEKLIADGVLVDLYTISIDALVVGTPDRSLRQVGRLADPELANRVGLERCRR